MSDTARDYQTAVQASIEGLEDLLEIMPTDDDNLATDADIVVSDADTREWCTAVMAASSLNKSERTIQRYAKSGKLRSKTDQAGRLLICLATSADNLTTGVDSVAKVGDRNANVPTNANTERLWDLLKEKDAKIEALIMRDGYMQAQYEALQQELKLLTDSQHKTGWWQRFCSWFIGR